MKQQKRNILTFTKVNVLNFSLLAISSYFPPFSNTDLDSTEAPGAVLTLTQILPRPMIGHVSSNKPVRNVESESRPSISRAISKQESSMMSGRFRQRHSTLLMLPTSSSIWLPVTSNPHCPSPGIRRQPLHSQSLPNLDVEHSTPP